MIVADKKVLVLFDGVCNLCNGTVQFIIKRDPAGTFKFASLQSETGQQAMRDFNIPPGSLNSIIVIENRACYDRSDAALRIAGHLSWPWRWFAVFQVLPRFIRDGIYQLIAKNRYRIFGSREACMLPTPELRDRFL